MPAPMPWEVKKELFDIVGYVPHKGQIEVHSSQAMRRVVAAGRRFGKTIMAAAEALAHLGLPGTRGWIVAPTYNMATRVFNILFRWAVVEHKVPGGVRRKSESDHYIIFNNGSEFWAKSADNPKSLLGEGLDFLIIDEAVYVNEEVWEHYLRPTLADKLGWALFISTPKGTYSWFYDLFIKGQQTDKRNWWASWQFPSWINPHLPKEFIEQEKHDMPEVLFRQEYSAEFVTVGDIVFPQFDTSRHVVETCIEASNVAEPWICVTRITSTSQQPKVTVAESRLLPMPANQPPPLASDWSEVPILTHHPMETREEVLHKLGLIGNINILGFDELI